MIRSISAAGICWLIASTSTSVARRSF